jgi:hypothetical protein
LLIFTTALSNVNAVALPRLKEKFDTVTGKLSTVTTALLSATSKLLNGCNTVLHARFHSTQICRIHRTYGPCTASKLMQAMPHETRYDPHTSRMTIPPFKHFLHASTDPTTNF